MSERDVDKLETFKRLSFYVVLFTLVYVSLANEILFNRVNARNNEYCLHKHCIDERFLWRELNEAMIHFY